MRLRNRVVPLIEEFHPAAAPIHRCYRVRLTAAGRRHYDIHHLCYRELYPHADAPAPALLDEAHTGLADHHVRRPPHLVRDTDLPALAALVGLEATGENALRRLWARAYRLRGQAVPPGLAGIPPGVHPHQLWRLTGSDKTIERLTGHPGGALVDVIDVTDPGGWHSPERLVVPTPHGREHYATHLAEYRRRCPDLPLPDPTPEPGPSAGA